MKKKVKKRSAAPLYGTAAVWALYCLLFPLYRPSHFLYLTVLGIASFVALTRLFPGTVTEVEIPEPAPEPVTTGNAEADALLREGEQAVRELDRLGASIKNETVRGKIRKIRELTEKIFGDILEDPEDIPQIKRFAGYYLPTTMKLLNAYDRMSGSVEGENVSGTLRRIEGILDATIEAYKKQYDALFANEALDIETDITVLQSMLRREGLADKEI